MFVRDEAMPSELTFFLFTFFVLIFLLSYFKTNPYFWIVQNHLIPLSPFSPYLPPFFSFPLRSAVSFYIHRAFFFRLMDHCRFSLCISNMLSFSFFYFYVLLILVVGLKTRYRWFHLWPVLWYLVFDALQIEDIKQANFFSPELTFYFFKDFFFKILFIYLFIFWKKKEKS